MGGHSQIPTRSLAIFVPDLFFVPQHYGMFAPLAKQLGVGCLYRRCNQFRSGYRGLGQYSTVGAGGFLG